MPDTALVMHSSALLIGALLQSWCFAVRWGDGIIEVGESVSGRGMLLCLCVFYVDAFSGWLMLHSVPDIVIQHPPPKDLCVHSVLCKFKAF